MPISAATKRPDTSLPAGRVITINTPEAQAYSNILSIVERPSVARLDEDSIELIRGLMQVTFNLSKRSVPDTSQAIVYAVLHWERWQAEASAGINPSILAYNALVTDFKAKIEDSGHKELTRTLLQRMIPLSYAIWAVACLTATAVFLTMFIYGLALNSFVIGPWLNLMLCVASIGLSATVVTAIADWRLKHNVRKPKR